jgi:hypothetical protein
MIRKLKNRIIHTCAKFAYRFSCDNIYTPRKGAGRPGWNRSGPANDTAALTGRAATIKESSCAGPNARGKPTMAKRNAATITTKLPVYAALMTVYQSNAAAFPDFLGKFIDEGLNGMWATDKRYLPFISAFPVTLGEMYLQMCRASYGESMAYYDALLWQGHNIEQTEDYSAAQRFYLDAAYLAAGKPHTPAEHPRYHSAPRDPVLYAKARAACCWAQLSKADVKAACVVMGEVNKALADAPCHVLQHTLHRLRTLINARHRDQSLRMPPPAAAPVLGRVSPYQEKLALTRLAADLERIGQPA